MFEATRHISNGPGRLLVMGDVHGQYEKMVRVLKLCGYRPGTDQLVLIGDYVDRGPDSRRLFLKLEPCKEWGDCIVWEP